MIENKRRTGIEVVGEVPWGTHICHFYQTKEDLIDILIPYFKAGLEDNEFCLWVTSEPLGVEEAKSSLRKVVRNLGNYIEKGQIEILDASQWYTRSGKFEADKVLQSWVEKERLAREKGFDGLRTSGNTSWLKGEDWKAFADYEATIDSIIGKYHMLAICSYSLEKCEALEIIEVLKNHGLALARREDGWELFESSRRKQAEEALRRSEQNFRNSLDNSPLGIRIVTAEGELLYANKAILDIYGYSSVEELKATPAKQRYTPESYAEHRERVKMRKLGKPAPSSYEVSIVRKDGEVRHLAVHRREVAWNGDTRFQLLYEDITERKQAEKTLRESEERHRQLYEGMNEAVALFRFPDFKIIYWNKCFENLSRLLIAKDVEDITTSDLAAMIESDDWNKAIEGTAKLVVGESIPDVDVREVKVKDLEGEKRFLEVKAALYKEQGQTVGVQVAITDITERKQAEKALRESEESYMRLYEGINEAVAFISLPDLKVAHWNKRFEYLNEQLLTKDVGDVTMSDMSSVIEAEDWDNIMKIIGKIPAGEPAPDAFALDIGVKDLEGKRRFLEVKASLYKEQGQTIGVQVAVTDITGRKQAEESLRVKDWAIRSSINAIAMADLAGNLIYVNPAFLNLWGYQYEEEVLGKPVTGFWQLKEDVAQVVAAVRTQGGWIGEMVASRQDGTAFTVGVVASTVMDDAGRPLCMMAAFVNITERKRAEEALRQSDEKYRALFDSAVIGTFVIDAETMKVVLGNQAAAKMFGFNSIEEAIGVNPLDFVSQDDRERVLKIILKDMFEQDLRQTGEFRAVTKDGREIWISAAGARLVQQGKPVGLISFTDITERKKAEGALQQSQERYRGVCEGMTEAVALFQLPDLKITYWNKRFEDYARRVYGKGPGGLSATDISLAVKANHWDKAMETLSKTLAGEPVPDVYELVVKDVEGNSRVIEVKPTFYKESGQVVGIQVMLADVSERKRAEEALKESEERYRTLFENSIEAVVTSDLEGSITSCNKAFEELTGYALEELRGMDWRKMAPPEDVKFMLKEYNKLFRTGEPIVDILYETVRKGGERRLTEGYINLVKRGNKIVGFQATIRDVTERKRAEGQLKQSFTNLAETVSRVVESRDSYTAGHQRGVAELARLVAKRAGLNDDEVLGVYIGALLHDIGKISIPASILTKIGELNKEEWALIRAHTKQGYSILKDATFPWPIADMALHHHERLDGSGYPNGISGDKLSLAVRILAVCDVVEAMSSHRPYRPARTKGETVQEIRIGRGTKYDASVVDEVLHIIENGDFKFSWNGKDLVNTITKGPVP